MYYIYHIKGVKTGCTNNLEKRQKQYRDGSVLILLETHDDILIARRRERELALEFGYPLDRFPYTIPFHPGHSNHKGGFSKEAKLKGDKAGGAVSGKIQRTCPKCGRTIKGNNYFRWHGDNCRLID